MDADLYLLPLYRTRHTRLELKMSLRRRPPGCIYLPSESGRLLFIFELEDAGPS